MYSFLWDVKVSDYKFALRTSWIQLHAGIFYLEIAKRASNMPLSSHKDYEDNSHLSVNHSHLKPLFCRAAYRSIESRDQNEAPNP